MERDEEVFLRSQKTFVDSPYFSLTKRRRDQNIVCQSNGIADRESSSLDNSGNHICLARNTRGTSGSYPGISYFATSSDLLRRLEQRVADDPWKLLIAVTLLNKTCGRLAVPAFWYIMMKWPTPLDLSQANEHELISVIRHLGTQNIRAKRLITLSRSYMQEPPSAYDVRPSTRLLTSPRRNSRFFFSIRASRYPATPISHLPGTGPYALDSYRIFSSEHENPGSDEWKGVFPADKELIRFLRWKWAVIEGMEWTPTGGAIRQVTEKYIFKLVTELENTTEGNPDG
ncbi:DNA glycosylase [Gymnopilus junonius]|uniref:DNA glycosylase n=1 Tax=Gymnopilus junonius TaxID=109634 RepID=A0A9P5TUD5_GYMJU|nr:DNA glycosylase [Gymnopilus junonius]